MAIQTVYNVTNNGFHSFGRVSEHVISLEESLSRAPYLVAGPVKTALESNSVPYEPASERCEVQETTYRTDPMVMPYPRKSVYITAYVIRVAPAMRWRV